LPCTESANETNEMRYTVLFSLQNIYTTLYKPHKHLKDDVDELIKFLDNINILGNIRYCFASVSMWTNSFHVLYKHVPFYIIHYSDISRFCQQGLYI
jgi:hypothetical protein